MFKLSKISSIAGLFALVAGVVAGPVTAASAATATINAVSFKAPVFDSYNHATGGGAWNDGSVTYDKGELLGTNYKCGDIATFLLELNTSATPTKQPAPYKAEIKLTYTWDATGQSGTSLTPLTDSTHLKVNTGQILKTYAGGTAALGTGTSGTDGGMNAAGALASVATSPAPAITNSGNAWPNAEVAGDEFKSGATSAVTFTVQNIQANANIVVRSDVVIHCKPNASPTGNMQAALTYVNVSYPGALETISAGNQTVNFRGVGNLGGLGASMSVTKNISTNGTDCTSTVASTTFSTAPASTPVLYCYTVTNTGNQDLTNLTLVDDSATPLVPGDDRTILLYDGSTWVSPLPTLAAGASTTSKLTGASVYTYSSTGAKTNIATATATPNGGGSAISSTASATVTFAGSTPDLSVAKSQTSANPSAVGDVITYNLLLTNNTGNNGSFHLFDTNASSVTCNGVTTLPSPTPTGANAPNGTVDVNNPTIGNTAGATITCIARHTVTAADVAAHSVQNSAYITKSSSTYYSNVVTTPIVAPATTYELSVVKTQTSTNKPAASGDTIVYSVVISNIGTGTITGLSLTDNLAGAVVGTCSPALPASLAAGASVTCPVTYSVTSTDITNKSVTNNATASGTGGGNTVTSQSNDVVTPVGASLNVLKIQATGSNTNTGQYPSAVGQILTYGITVSNNGNLDLFNVKVADANATTLQCFDRSATPVNITSLVTGSGAGVALVQGAAFDCNASHTVTAADLTAGSITNIANATASTSNGGPTNLTGQSQNVTTVAAVHIVKSIASVTRNGSTVNSSYTAGDVVHYNIVVTNTGEVALTNVAVADSRAVSVSCPATSLAAGVSMTCTAVHTVTLAEAGANHVLNTATVSSTQIPTPIVSNETDLTGLVVPSAPHISVVKSRTSAAPVNEGDVITYSITVTSDGSGSATVTALTDASATLGACTQGSNAVTFSKVLAQNTSFTCTATHTVTSADMRAGSYSNQAHVAANDGGGTPVDLSTDSNTVVDPLTATASMSVVKSYSGSPQRAGDVISYTIVATNTGTMVLTGATITDAKLGTLVCSPSIPVSNFAPGATISCTGNYTVQAADVTAGQVVNTAVGSYQYNGQPAVSVNSNTVTVPVNVPATPAPVPGLGITKAVNGAAPSKVGDVISYKITVTNTGQVDLAGVTVTDANATVGACSVALPAALATGASLTCAATHVVSDADFAAGKVDNVATAASTTGSLSATSNVVSVPLAPVSGISITKALDGAAPSKAGDVITYKIVVTNTGNVTLNNVVVADANATIETCAPGNNLAVLAPSATITCAATHVVTNADMQAGKVDNVATVAATSIAGAVSGSAGTGAGSSTGSGSSAKMAATSQVVTVPLVANPAIAIVKAQTGALPTALGDYIHYTITVTNTGNITLHNVTVSDNNATDLVCDNGNPATELTVGAQLNCTAKHKLTVADVEAGKVINVASVTSAENATATSGASAGTPGASNGSGSGSTATPGSIANKSNEVITLIHLNGARYPKTDRPNGGTVNLGAAALKNPKLQALAFTGDVDNVADDGALTVFLMAAFAAIAFAGRRRFQRG